jgi:uncharacterized protein (TIGR00255 family)
MKSMTGYGRATAAVGEHTLAVQVSSVNRKTLDLSVSLPEGWDHLEDFVGGRVKEFASRGKIHVVLELSRAAADDLEWNEDAVDAVLDRLSALAADRGIPFAPTPELLWQVANSQRKAAQAPTPDAGRPAVEAALEAALHDFAVMRAREGEALLVDLLGRLGALRRHLDTVALRAPQVAPAYREILHRRLREAGLDLDLDDERVLKEIALFADRCDISEEITRFRSHLDQLGGLLKSDSEIGRKAEFLLQELSREAHTMGAKANDLAISRHVIDLKNEIERVREQMANVE